MGDGLFYFYHNTDSL